MSDGSEPRKRSSHVGLLLAIGVVLVLANLAFVGWWTGYFKPKEKVALVTWNQDPYWDQVVKGAKDAAAELKVDLTVIQSNPDEQSQSQHVRDLLGQGVKGIAISPNNPASQEMVLKEVAEKSALVTFDSDAPVSDRKAFVGSDNYAAGRLAGEEVRAAIPDGGEVLISIGSIDLENGRERRQGLVDELLRRPRKPGMPPDPIESVLKGSEYSVVATVLDHGDPAKAATIVADALKSHPDVKCVVGLFSYSGPAALKGIESAGKAGKIKVIAFDELDATQAGVEAGTIYSSILQDQYRCGYETVMALVEAVRGTNQSGPSGPRIVALRLMVMHKEDIPYLRSDKVIHPPAGK